MATPTEQLKELIADIGGTMLKELSDDV